MGRKRNCSNPFDSTENRMMEQWSDPFDWFKRSATNNWFKWKMWESELEWRWWKGSRFSVKRRRLRSEFWVDPPKLAFLLLPHIKIIILLSIPVHHLSLLNLALCLFFFFFENLNLALFVYILFFYLL